jgi:hypothetical protein
MLECFVGLGRHSPGARQGVKFCIVADISVCVRIRPVKTESVTGLLSTNSEGSTRDVGSKAGPNR